MIDLDAMGVAHRWRLTVRVRRVREARFRLWLAAKLIRLAAWVIGCGVEIQIGPPLE